MHFVSSWLHLWIILTFTLKFWKTLARELPLRPANVLFLVDESNSIWEPDFKRELRFVKETARRFEIGKNYTRVALVTYALYAKVRFDFNVYDNIESLVVALDKIRRPESVNTRIAQALKSFPKLLDEIDDGQCSNHQINEKYFNLSQEKSRQKNGESSRSYDWNGDGDEIDVPINIAVLLGDGIVDDFKEASVLANCLRRQNIHLFSVGVGRNYIKRTMDEFSSRPNHRYRISICNSDPPNSPSDAISESKSAKIWELMIKNKAMAEDCIAHRQKIFLNFVFDIVSKKSWRYPILIRIAKDMYFRLMKSFNVTKNLDYVRIRFFPRSYGLNDTAQMKKGSHGHYDEKSRFEELLAEGKKLRRASKISAKDGNNPGKKKAWELLNSVIPKVTNYQPHDRQQIIIYMTDRETEQTSSEDAKEISRIVRIYGKSFEMFTIALGGRISESKLSSLLRQYHMNPQSRLFVFDTLMRNYEEAMENFIKLFCPLKLSKKLP